MKKTLFSFLLCSGLFGVLVGCFCRDVLPYWNITTMEVHVAEVSNWKMTAVTDSIVETDSLGLMFYFGFDFLAMQQPAPNPFIHSAYASSCPSEGHRGMKDEFTTIVVTSNADFNGIAAGQSLNSTIRIFNQDLDTWMANKGFNELVSYFGHPELMELLLIEKPLNHSIHDFTITLNFASGRSEVLQTGPHTWI